MVLVKIDGRELEVPKDYTIFKACEAAGAKIPTFCYDERLSRHGAGACRICLVEIEGQRNLMPSCTEKVWEGISVFTKSERVIKERKGILELMVQNHPLDCLTCEKSGDCKLQDYCYEYGVTGIKGLEERVLPVDESNPFYTFDPDKCILCGKCVRVCEELQGTRAILISERGPVAKVSTQFEEGLENSPCVSCGNCVSYCPVGALLPKSKTEHRVWETKKVRTTCSYCGVGCQLELIVKGDEVVGVQPAMGAGNDGLLCVKGKFAYNFVNHPDRLKKPLIRKDGVLVEATWEEALSLVAKKISGIKSQHGADSIAGLTSARCTNEENYLFQKLLRAAVGTNNVDHCARL